MKISELICALVEIKQKYGNIEALIATNYTHHSVKWVDYSKPHDKSIEHACIRMDDENISINTTP